MIAADDHLMAACLKATWWSLDCRGRPLDCRRWPLDGHLMNVSMIVWLPSS